MNTTKHKKAFIRKLDEKNANVNCPICKNIEMYVEGPFTKTIQSDPKTIKLGGPSLLTFAVICKKCGYLREFAVGPLGLLDSFTGKEGKNA